jgi:hypothetical protein
VLLVEDLQAVDRRTSVSRKVDRRNHIGKAASRAKATSSTNTFRKLIDYENLGSIDLSRVSDILEAAYSLTYSLNDQLCNSVALVDGEIGLAEVEEQNLERTAVISVNDTGTNIDRVLCSKSGARSYSAVCTSCQEELYKQTADGQNIHVSAGTAIEISVSASTLPLAGTVVLFDA